MKIDIQKFLFGITFIILLITFYFIPLSTSGYPHGHDLFFHFSRIQGSVELLKVNHWSLDILPGFFYDFGYAVGLFYSTGLLWIPIILNTLGLSFISSYKVFILFITVLTSFSMYYTSHKLFKNHRISFVSTLFYVFNVYRNYTDLYERAAIGEFIAFAFIPLVFYGLYSVVVEKKKSIWPLSMGMLGLILSHTLSTLLTLVFILIFLILNLKSVITNRKSIMYLFGSALITLLLSAYYWIPMLEMMASDQFNYQYPWTSINQNVLTSVSSMVYINHESSIFPYGIELYALIIVFIGILRLYSKWKHHKFIVFSVLSGGVALGIATNIIPVEWYSFLNFMQFPWRMFVFVNYFIAILLGYSLYHLTHSKTRVVVIAVFSIYVVFNYISFSNYYVQDRMKDYVYKDFVRYFYADAEFMPTSVDIKLLKQNEFNKTIDASHPILIEYSRTPDGYVLSFDQFNYSNTVIELPLIYYQGYAAYFQGSDVQEFLPISKSEDSLIEVNLLGHQKGDIKVFYNGTRLTKLSHYVSLTTLLLIIIVVIGKKILKSKIIREKA